MRLVLLACAGVLFAQVATPPELVRARQEVERTRALVEAGVAPRKALENAEAALAEANDHVVLRRTLYADLQLEDLTEQQADDMVAAARRQVDSQRRKTDAARLLVAEGVLARSELAPLDEELARRRRTLELAEDRAKLFRDLVSAAQAEYTAAQMQEVAPSEAVRVVERYDGAGEFATPHLRKVVLAFEKEFRKPLPVSARGQSAVHRALGFDHRGRVDVAIEPDSAEGIWLRAFLASERIPYFAFRAPVEGKATGAHIHLGPASLRLRAD
jgi:hypothetical protein